MGIERKIIVSNSGPLIHLAQIDRLQLLRDIFGKVIIPEEVRVEVIDMGKNEGAADAFLLEDAIEEEWIIVERNSDERVKEIAEKAGIDAGEAEAIMLGKKENSLILLDDLAARRFAAGLGLEVAGSVGVILRATKMKILPKSEALEALEKLARVMWLSVDIYEDARKCIESMKI